MFSTNDLEMPIAACDEPQVSSPREGGFESSSFQRRRCSTTGSFGPPDVERPHRGIHRFWKDFDRRYMKPTFGGQGEGEEEGPYSEREGGRGEGAEEEEDLLVCARASEQAGEKVQDYIEQRYNHPKLPKPPGLPSQQQPPTRFQSGGSDSWLDGSGLASEANNSNSNNGFNAS
ncbi:hypothetical protein Naga_100683g1 [Nannochloropsis gaditana]|uniref:Uncharacterized protein n=1 Tax=Nannochloropsis gaditana TaxID=72520 RepID=W7T1F3_9STRA|nr:hypothetical protein Naga_100683g1 [Nannochloropsis gaditana]